MTVRGYYSHRPPVVARAVPGRPAQLHSQQAERTTRARIVEFILRCATESTSPTDLTPMTLTPATQRIDSLRSPTSY